MARLKDLRPVGATPNFVTSAVVANAAAVATVPAVAGKQFCIEGYNIQALGATAAGTVTATLTGIGVTKSDIIGVPAGVNTAITPVGTAFPIPIVGLVNTAVVLTLPALGAGNTKAVVCIWGHYRDA